MSENEKKERETYYNSKPRLGGNGPSKIRQQFNRGMTYFLVIAASLAFYFALLRFRHIFNVLWKVYDVLKPIIYGAVIAYLLNPIVKRVDKRLHPCIREKGYKTGKSTEYFQICRCVYIADYIGRIDICFMQPTDTGIIC